MPSERIQRRIGSLLDEADMAAGKNDWRTVRERAEAVLAFDPENTEASEYLRAAQRAVDSSTAIESANAARPASPESSPASAGTPVPTGPALPTSFASGRYAVKKFLGEGGKKKVFLAHDTTLDRDVAFALIKSEGLDDSSRQRITREAQAMGRLGDHPNIVPIFDLGQEKDPTTGVQQPFMVLPVMTGGDVEGVIEKSPEHRMPLERVLQIAKDTCEGLVFAHSKGIVHRDLKPGNVWLTERGAARIGDFGLAVATDRSRLTREGTMVGTVAYMPPEQAMGGEITPRADLYSLGAMLYEMVTGRPPFLGDDDIAIIGQHINTPPVAPGWHNPQCPKPLEALIMRLLAKDPAQRPESAKDVLAALGAVSVAFTTASAPIAAVGQQGPVRSLDSMSSGVFVGRQKEMDALRAALEETLSGHGRMLTLVGEPGIGKTRAAQELATYAGLRRCQVLWGRCYEGGGAPPYWPWVQAIRQYVNEKDASEVKSAMTSSASVIAEVVPDVKEKIPGVTAPPALESPESARFRLFDSITTFLKNASRSQSLVLVLDDLHWSDKPSLLLLEFVARELSNSRVLLIGTYRDMELNRKHPLSVTLGDLTRERLYERVLLRGLQKEDVDRFIEIASGVKAPSGLTDAVLTQTEGNPLFVTETVRLLIQEGHLAPGKVSKSKASTSTTTAIAWTVRIPEGVKGVIGRRLDRLSDRCNDVLTTAAVIGRRFSLAALVKLYSDPKLSPEERISEDRLLELTEEADAARIIEELPSGPGRYQFTHALMQETLTSELSTTRKVRLHARIALALEEIYGENAERRAAELAQHFAEAETMIGTEKLVKYSLIAGEQALASFGYEEALQHFQRGLSAVQGRPIDEAQARLCWGLGRAQTATLGRLQQQTSVNTLRRAAEYFLGAGDTDSAVRVAESLPSPVAGGGTAATDTASVIEHVMGKVQPGTAQEARLLANYIESVGVERGDLARADWAYQRVSEFIKRSPEPRIELRAETSLAVTNAHNSRVDDLSAQVRRILELGKGQGDLVAQSKAYLYLIGDVLRSGKADDAERLAVEFLSIAEKLKSVHELEDSLSSLAGIAFLRGRWSESKQFLERGLTMSPDHPLLFARQFAIDLLSGNFDASERWIEKALRLVQATSPGASHPYQAAIGMIPMSAYVSGKKDRLPMAKTLAGTVLALPGVALSRQRGIRWSMGLIAVVQGDAETCRGIHSEATNWIRGGALYTFIHTDRLRGLMAQTFGDTDLARRHLEDAVSFLRPAGYRVDLAWALYELATVIEQAGKPAGEVAALCDEALDIARELRMKPLIERIIGRKKILKA